MFFSWVRTNNFRCAYVNVIFAKYVKNDMECHADYAYVIDWNFKLFEKRLWVLVLLFIKYPCETIANQSRRTGTGPHFCTEELHYLIHRMFLSVTSGSYSKFWHCDPSYEVAYILSKSWPWNKTGNCDSEIEIHFFPRWSSWSTELQWWFLYRIDSRYKGRNSTTHQVGVSIIA